MKSKVISLIIVFTMVLSLFAFVAPQSAAAAPSPGIVYTQGTQFVLDGYPFYFAGCNSYDLFTRSTAEIDQRMANMAADGVKVLRTWGFSHETWHGFEPQKGVYSEDEFKLFDYIMKSAKQNGIKVIITLENYWEAYGGIDARLAWEGLPGLTYANRVAFFTNANCKQGYKNYVEHFVNRVNAYTGVAYKDDPTIFSWELMNEPRCEPGDTTGTTLRAWVDEMAAFIKSMDSKHMVSTGQEGQQTKYGYGGDCGNPFVYIQQSPYIDFCCAHPYPDESWAQLTPAQAATLVDAWISDAHNVVGKPLVLEEFNTHQNKDLYWNAMLGEIEKLGAAGDTFWNYNTSSTSDFDLLHGDPLLTSIFKPHSDRMAAKNGSPVHAPLAFNQTAPANGATGVLPRCDLKWGPSVGAKTYNLVVSANSDYSSPIVNVTGIAGTQYAPTVDLAFSTKYYWKVTGVNPLGNTVASNAGISFTTRAAATVAPGTFSQTVPTDGLVVGTKPTFTWAASTEALTYTLVVSKNSDLSSPVINVSNLTATSYTPSTDLTMNTKYYWKVTAVNNIGSTAASNSGISFTTIDLPPVNTTAKIQANGSASASQVGFKVVVCNTGLGTLDKFAARVYVNLSEVLAAGLTLSDVVCESIYDQSGSCAITGPLAWDAANNIYYYQLDFGSYVLAAGSTVENNIRLRFKGWQSGWDSSNDYSYTGLTATTADTQYIPLYHGNLKLWGNDPGQGSTPTATPTPTPSAATATPTPTPSTATATPTPTPSTATATPTPTPSTATATPTPTPSTATATPTPMPGTATATPTPTPGTATVTPTPTPTPTAGTPTPGGIKVQFFNGNTAATTNTLYPNFKVVNTGTTAISLSDVKVRYYFTNDGMQANSFACDYSTVGSGNITSSFTTIAKTNADRYLEVGFTSSAGTLAAGAGAEVKGRVWKSDWSNFTQTNDYSFNATATNYVDSTTVTGYIAGALKWGTEP